MFLYRADLHRIVRDPGEAPEHYAARIRQAAPPCCLQTDSGTADYLADLMSSIFILGLSDQYTKEKLFQILAKAGKFKVDFAVKFFSASASESLTAKYTLCNFISSQTKSNQVGLSPISSRPCLAPLDSADLRLDSGRLGWT